MRIGYTNFRSRHVVTNIPSEKWRYRSLGAWLRRCDEQDLCPTHFRSQLNNSILSLRRCSLMTCTVRAGRFMLSYFLVWKFDYSHGVAIVLSMRGTLHALWWLEHGTILAVLFSLLFRHPRANSYASVFDSCFCRRLQNSFVVFLGVSGFSSLWGISEPVDFCRYDGDVSTYSTLSSWYERSMTLRSRQRVFFVELLSGDVNALNSWLYFLITIPFIFRDPQLFTTVRAKPDSLSVGMGSTPNALAEWLLCLV